MNWFYYPNLALDDWTDEMMERFLDANPGEECYSDYLFGLIGDATKNSEDGLVPWDFRRLWNDRKEVSARDVRVCICTSYLDEKNNFYVLGTVSGDKIQLIREPIEQRHIDRSEDPIYR